MLLDLLPCEQAAPQRPARVVGGSMLLDTLVYVPAPTPAPTVNGGGGPLRWRNPPRPQHRDTEEDALFLLGVLS